MDKIDSFNTSSCKIVGKTVEETLANLGKELGLTFTYDGGKFDPKTFTFKIRATVLNPDGSITSEEEENFKTFAILWGMKPDDLGKNIKIGKKLFKITGANPSAHKYPIMLTDVMTGKCWKYPDDVVKAALNGNPDFIHVSMNNRWKNEETGYED